MCSGCLAAVLTTTDRAPKKRLPCATYIRPVEGRRPEGDSLVHVDSAQGQRAKADMTLQVPPERQLIGSE